MDDIFSKLRKRYGLPETETPSEQKPSRTAPTGHTAYDPLFDKYGKEFGVDPDLLRAMAKQESAYNPRAISNKNAQGLMQLIPDTAKRFGVKDPFDPDQNIAGGTKYMRWLLDRYNGDVDKALAGYNAGEGAVDKYKGIPPFRETQDYVKTIRSNYRGSGLLGALQPSTDFNSLRSKYGLQGESVPGPDFDALRSKFGLDGGNQPATQLPPTNPVPTFLRSPNAPMPETITTIEKQATSALDANSPRAAVLLTDPSQIRLLTPSLTRTLKQVSTPDGILLVNEAKARQLGATDYVRDMAKLIGKVDDVGRDTGSGPTVVTLDRDGNELASSRVTSLLSAKMQAEIDKASFPDSAKQQIVDAQDVVAKREDDLKKQIQTLGGLTPEPFADATEPPFAPPPLPGPAVPEPTMEQLPWEGDLNAEYDAYVKYAQQNKLPVMSKQQFIVDVVGKAGQGEAQATDYQTQPNVPQQAAPTQAQRQTRPGETASISRQRQVGQPTSDLNRSVIEYTAPKSITTEEDALRQALRATGELTPNEINRFIANRKRDGIKLLAQPLSVSRTIQVPYHVIAEAKGDASRVEGDIAMEQAQTPVGTEVSQKKYGRLPETQAEQAIDKRIREKDYVVFQKLTEALQAPWMLMSPTAGVKFASDPSDEWLQAEKKRLKEQYGSYANAYDAEQYYQNTTGLEKTVRTFNQGARAFLKNLVGGTAKTAVFLSQLQEDYDPINQLLPDNAKIGLRNAGNIADFISRLVTSGSASTAYKEMDWVKSLDGIDRQQFFKAIQEFDKAVGDEPVLKGRFLGSLGDAGGSAASFIALGAMMPSLVTTNFWGTTRNWGQAVSGVAQMVGSGYEEGKRSDLDEATARKYGLIQGALGVTEMLGAGAELAQFLKSPGLRRQMAQALVEVGSATAREMKQEFAQEVFQTTAGKAVMEYLKDNDESTWRKLYNAVNRLPKQLSESIANEGIIAMITGGVMGGGGRALQLATQSADTTVDARPVNEIPASDGSTTVVTSAQQPQIFTDKQGRRFEVIADLGDKVRVRNERGGEQIRNKRGLTEVNEKTPEVSKPTAQVDAEPLVQDQADKGEAAKPIRVYRGSPTDELGKGDFGATFASQSRPAIQRDKAPEPKQIRYREDMPAGLVDEAPLNPQTLTGAKERIKEVEEQRDTARREAETDPLTGVANRRALDRALPTAEADENTSVIAFDANNFGQINKKVSEKEGDKVLKEMAKALETAAKENGARVFRKGGDEFAILAPKAKAESIRDRAEELFGSKKYDGFEVSVSGVVGNTFDEADSQLQDAKAKRKAKKSGVEASKSEDFRNALQSLLGKPNKGLAGMIYEGETESFRTPKAFTYTTRGTNKKTVDVDVVGYKSKNGTRYLAMDGDLIVAGAFVDNNNVLTGIITEGGMTKVGIGTNLAKTVKKLNPAVRFEGVASKEGQRLIKRLEQPEPKKSAKQRLAEKGEAKPQSPARERLAKKKGEAKEQTFPEFLKERLGEQWYVSDRPIKRRDAAGEKRIKRSDYRRLEEEFKATAPKKPVAEAENFQDYGEKIGGAKKDIYQRLEVTDNDLETLPLSKSFPRPDFAKLISEGVMTKDTAKVLSFLYDSIPPKPRKKWRIPGWVEQVRGAIDLVNTVFTSKPEVAANLVKLTAEAGKEFLSGAYEVYSAWLDVTGFPEKTMSMQGYSLKKIKPWKKDATPAPQYLVLKGPFIKGEYQDAKSAAEALYEALTATPDGPKTQFSIYEDRQTKDLFIGKKGAKGVVRLAEGFKSLKEAREYQKANQIALEEMWEARKYKQGVERKDSGEETRVGKDWRDGKDIASTEEFAKTFGFKGVEFGNWVKQGASKNERQTAINDAYDALMDLADILKIDPRALSLNGSLSLALGARGSGAANAHYEPGKVVINLTKTRGKGSLGHEWWHALDNYFSRMRGAAGDFVTNFPHVRKVKDSGMFVDDPRIRKELLEGYSGVVDAIRASGLPGRSGVLDATRNQPYWSTMDEMSARAFENYLITELGQQGRQSDHLANFRDMGEWAKHGLDANAFPYPLDAEQGPINDAFRALFETMEQVEDESGNVSLKMAAGEEQTETEAFKKWFGESKVVDADGKPLRVFHGTERDFERFEARKPIRINLVDGKEIQTLESWDTDGSYTENPEAYHWHLMSDLMVLGSPKRVEEFRRKEMVSDSPSNRRYWKDFERLKDSKVTHEIVDRPSGDAAWFTPDTNYSFISRQRGDGSFAGGQVMPVYLSIQNPKYVDHSEVEGGGRSWNVEKYKQEGYDGLIAATRKDDLTYTGWDGATQIVAFYPNQIKSAIGNRGTFDPNEDSILKMAADDSSLERFRDYAYAHTQTVLEDAKSEIKEVDGQTVLELNEAGAELARRVEASASGKKVDQFYGSTYTTGQLKKLAQTAKEWADRYEEKGYTADQVKSMRDLAANLDTLAEKGGAGVVYTFDFALPHETHHKLVLDALGGKAFPKQAIAELEALDIWNANPTITTPDGQTKSFNSAYPSLSKQHKVFEMAAMLETGEISHSDKDRFLDIFARGILEVTTELDPVQFARILNYANTQASDIQRDRTEQTDSEPDERPDGPASTESEGNGERADDPRTGERASGRTADDARSKTEKGQRIAAFSRILGQEYPYTPQDHSETDRLASQLISDKGIEQAINEAIYGQPSAEGMRVLQWELERLNGLTTAAVNKGNDEEANAYANQAADLASKIIQRQIATGQEVEINKRLLPLSPEAALLTAQRLLTYTKGPGAQLSGDQTKAIIQLAEELKVERAKNAEAEENVAKLRRRIKALETERPERKRSTPQKKMLEEYRREKPKLLEDLRNLFPNSPVFNGDAEALRMVAGDSDILRMAATRDDVPLDADTIAKLAKYAAGEILEGKPYKVLIDEIEAITGAEMDTVKEIHAMAVDNLRGASKELSDTAKERIKLRQEHYRQATHFVNGEVDRDKVADVARMVKGRLNSEIKKLEEEIETKQLRKKGEPVSTPEIETLKARAKKLKAERDEVLGLDKIKEQKHLEQAINRTKKAIDDLRERIKKHDFTPKEKKTAAESLELRSLRAERDILSDKLAELRKLKNTVPRNREIEMSNVTRRAMQDDRYKDDEPLIEAIERLTGAYPKSINDVINDLREIYPEMSMADLADLARKAQAITIRLKQEMAEEKDKLKGIMAEQRAAMIKSRIAKQKATIKLNRFLNNLANDPNWIKRMNDDFRAKFVLNFGTQLFNVTQALTVSTPAEILMDLFEVGLKNIGLRIGDTPDINVKDILLPYAYIAGNYRHMAESALSEFPDQFYQVHSGLLGDIELEKLQTADRQSNIASRTIHKWFDKNQILNDKLAHLTGAKLQEMHFRNAIVAAAFDQIIRRKSGGTSTLEQAIANNTVRNFVTEQDAQFAANKAMRVTFAALIDDKPGRALKSAYDKLDHYVPIFLNPVVYARFTYTTTKLMVLNPITFGILNSAKLGGTGYTTRDIASGVLAWSGIATAAALMATFGDDDDDWYTLKFGDTTVDIRRWYPASTFFYMAHLLRRAAVGKPVFKGNSIGAITKELLEGFASLETDYFTYGAGMELVQTGGEKLGGTKEWSDVGASGARFAGNALAGYARFFKPMRDVLAQFDKEEAKSRFYNDTATDKFIKEISRSVPLIARAYNAETNKDAKGNDILQPFPAGRLVGINVVHPSYLRPKQTPATAWATKLFRFAGSGQTMTAEQRKAASITRAIKNAIRRGDDVDIKQRLQEIKQSGELSKGKIDRLKNDLEMSELEAAVKWYFNATKEKEVNDLRKVWSYATEKEKAGLRKILKSKPGRTPEFNQEFGL